MAVEQRQLLMAVNGGRGCERFDIQHARSLGATIRDDLLAHVAPLGWEHIALTGDYVWANGNAASDFRPLRDVPSVFMARAA